MRRQYINPPPDFPMFMYKNRPEYVLPALIEWANKEYNDGLKFAAERGYWKELAYVSSEYSPLRVLAEMSGFRKICAYVQQGSVEGWKRVPKEHREFIMRSYELRDLLYRLRGR